MRRRRAPRFALLALAGCLPLVVAGCPKPGCPTTPHASPARALRMHRSLTRTVTALRAEARVDQRGPEGRIRGTVLLFLERPDRVRFDAMTQLGPAAVLTSDGSAFQLLDMREDRFLQGPTCPANIGRLLGIRLGGEELTRFLLGDTPRLETDDVTMACGEEGYEITLRAEDGRTQEIVLGVREADREAPPEQQHLRLRRSELRRADGSVDWRATFDEFRVVPDPNDPEGRGVALPFEVRFVDPDTGADTLVRFRSIELLDEPVREGVFRQTPPPGVTVESVSCD
ncbi:MAG TPA: DUF4292 domain-containing protein [Polyangiaceae bacterium LLY-WYZ-15_(1-7)]|nr:hypothetical protein [Sandaracinus sp.]HJL06022.1 DUF4292 domain-containing protein [Polyangiaceae bacterium LLY-WYZ-15_(1-7)]MBJ70110.1 hypothetical protein [Sandaracinus sp.]HJL10203.1 DUF4292 domain-containing protein [Polyangiaceae bacterium LLY-WYZ-15_(1-7)]HJL23202.1 DUF4292 domain-containing protein [Polyangiaceae bacterium LLY-WYZ-15_(1-7)]